MKLKWWRWSRVGLGLRRNIFSFPGCNWEKILEFCNPNSDGQNRGKSYMILSDSLFIENIVFLICLKVFL